MNADHAAAYCGYSTTTFLAMVDDGVMPQPYGEGRMKRWDKRDLDAAIDEIKQAHINTVDQILAAGK
jgi:predicted DNA-binding transcriptional regulator AlpA